MKTLDRQEAQKEWGKFWNDLKEEWFKVEVLQDYSGEDICKSLKAWFRGDKEESIKLIGTDVQALEWAKINKGTPFKKIRIHIVEEPFTPYLLWEIENYRLINIPLAGEEVSLINRDNVKELGIPDGDFMIFDNKRAVKNYYDREGKMYKADFYYEEDDINTFLELKKKLVEKARSLH